MWLVMRKALKTQDKLRIHLAGMEHISPIMDDIVAYLIPMAHKRNVLSVIGKLIVAACTYFIWRKRNTRLFKNIKIPPEDVSDAIMVTVRLKLLTLRFKNKERNIPNTIVTSISRATQQPWMQHCYSHIEEHRNQSMPSRTVLKRLFYDAMYLNYEKGEYDGKAVPIKSISGNPDLKDKCRKLVDPDQTMYRAFVDGFIRASDYRGSCVLYQSLMRAHLDEPYIGTYSIIVIGLSKSLLFTEAKSLLHSIENKGFPLAHLYLHIFKGMLMANQPKFMLSLFIKMAYKRNIRTKFYTYLVFGLISLSLYDAVDSMILEMFYDVDSSCSCCWHLVHQLYKEGLMEDNRFPSWISSAVVHQEGLAAAFGNRLPTACIVNMGAQDGVALPHTQITLRYEGEVEAVGVVHSYEDGLPPASHKTMLTALNFLLSCHHNGGGGKSFHLKLLEFVIWMALRLQLTINGLLTAPMGLFYPPLLVPDVYPPPPRTWFKDYEDMLEDNLNIDFARRTDVSDSLYPGISNPLQMWDNYPYMQPNQQKKEEKIGLAEAISKSILSAVSSMAILGNDDLLETDEISYSARIRVREVWSAHSLS
ncbi:actin-related protein 9 [Tanacetum coccineum]